MSCGTFVCGMGFCFRLDRAGGHALEYHLDPFPGRDLPGPDEAGTSSARPLVVGTGGLLEGEAPTFHGTGFRRTADGAGVVEFCDVNGTCPYDASLPWPWTDPVWPEVDGSGFLLICAADESRLLLGPRTGLFILADVLLPAPELMPAVLFPFESPLTLFTPPRIPLNAWGS